MSCTTKRVSGATLNHQPQTIRASVPCSNQEEFPLQLSRKVHIADEMGTYAAYGKRTWRCSVRPKPPENRVFFFFLLEITKHVLIFFLYVAQGCSEPRSLPLVSSHRGSQTLPSVQPTPLFPILNSMFMILHSILCVISAVHRWTEASALNLCSVNSPNRT